MTPRPIKSIFHILYDHVIYKISSSSLARWKSTSLCLLVTFCALLLYGRSEKYIDSSNHLVTTPIDSENFASLAISIISDQPSYLTGEVFTYRISYRCASLTDDCMGTMITDPLPPEVQFISLVGSAHTVNESYDAASHTVTFTFENPLAAGSTGEVLVNVSFPNGITPNNTVANNTVTINATNAPATNATLNISAVASVKTELNKSLFSGGAVDGHSSILLTFCNDLSSTNKDGTLTLRDIVIRDTLEPGTIYVGPNLAGADNAVYDPVNHVISFFKDELRPGQCIYPRAIIEYPSPTFSAGQTVSNTAHYFYTPVGDVMQVETRSLSFDLLSLYAQANSQKFVSQPDIFKGRDGQYRLFGTNDGTMALDDFCIIDSIPDGIEVTDFTQGAWFYAGLQGISDRIDIYYTTNLNSPRIVPGSPFSISPTERTSLGDLGLVVGGPEYITRLEWCFGDVPVGFFQNSPIEVDFVVKTDAPDGIALNCTDLSTSTPDADLDIGCVALNILPGDPGIKLNPIKGTGTGGTFNRGEDIDFQLVVRNEFGAEDSITNPVIYDLLPVGISYVPGSWFLPAWGNVPGYPDPSFSHITNYKGTGRDFLRWEWTGANGIKIPAGERVAIQFDATITESALGGMPAFANYYYVETSSAPIDCWGNGSNPDIYDFNDNGDVTEVLCGGRHEVSINEVVSLESKKLVQGQLDDVFTKYPEVATTVPGGITDYRLIVSNSGNIPLDSVVVIDILPHVNDRGVIDLSARESRWTPNLVGAVMVPTGVTVYYSTETNPCRSDEMIVLSGPPGCNAPNWSSTPPPDITSVRSLKFDFGSITLNPADSLVLEWPMRAPVNALNTIGAVPDSIAWNSFGYIGQRSDNGRFTLPTEPIKVGIELDNNVPAVIGDRVWLDNNNNGIQEVIESGVDGVRIELYEDNGDGISDPSSDTYVNFSLTANNGYYLFPALPGGDYYLVFYKPPTYDIVSPDRGGNDARDSDGFPGTFNGHSVAITPVTTLSDIEFDPDWDLGLHPSGLSAVGNYIWADLNSDGQQNETMNEGINGVVVNLYDNLNPGTILSSVTSFNDPGGHAGYYLFDDLSPGDYSVEFVLPTGVLYTTQGPVGTSDAQDSDPSDASGRTEVFGLNADQYDQSWDAGLILSGAEVCGNGIDDDLNGLIDDGCVEICGDGLDNDMNGIIDCLDLSGRIFEDINYGGGDGRNYNIANTSAIASGWGADAIAVANARIELYDSVGDFISATTSDAIGQYSFEVDDVGRYFIRVVNNTIGSNRALNGFGAPLWPVQTFLSDGDVDIVNQVGGRMPAFQDAGDNLSGVNITGLNTPISTPQSFVEVDVTVGSGGVLESKSLSLDFGFNFDLIVNTNDEGQGSLRQFLLHSTDLDNANLDQEDNPTGGVSFAKAAGLETSIFMIPGAGVHTIIPLTTLPAMRDDYTHLTGYTQQGSIQGPINSRSLAVELKGNSVIIDGLNAGADFIQISGLVVNEFRTGIRTSSSGQGLFIWGNYVGTSTDGSTGLGNSSAGINVQSFDASFIGTNGDATNDANEGNLVADNDFGIQLRFTSDVLIAGNIIGLDKDGTNGLGNTFNGIQVRDATGRNIIGFDDGAISTLSAHFRNISSANGNDGVRIIQSSNQRISGNYFGTDITGTLPLGNTNFGIQLEGTSSNNIFGTDSDGDDDVAERNILSANATGIRFLVSGTGTGNRISGNYIGVDVTGLSDLGNARSGIDINSDYSATLIGTNGDNVHDGVERNVISGNGDDGIRFSNTDQNIIAGNLIGVGADGTTAIPNDKRGIFFTLGSSDNIIGYDPSMANQDELMVGNVIRNNGDAAFAHSGSGIGNRVSRNQMENNAALGIDLDYDLVTTNDDGDIDVGPNGLLNFPVFTSVVLLEDNLTITGFAPPSSTIEVFVADSGPNPNPLPGTYTTSFGEGARYLFDVIEGDPSDQLSGTSVYTNDGTGIISNRMQSQFQFVVDVTGLSLSEDMMVTATATDMLNNTSEFSGVTNISSNCGTAIMNPHVMYFKSRN